MVPLPKYQVSSVSYSVYISLNNIGLIYKQCKGGRFMATAKSIKAEGKRVAKEAAYSPMMDRLTRLGYAVKGFIYVAMGYIAFLGAMGKSSTPADQLGAIGEFSKLPYADIFLWIILIGLISYSIWGVIRAVLDPFHKGTDLE